MTTPLRKKLLDLAISGKLVPKTGEWKTVGLDDVVEVLSGQDFPPSGYNDQARGMPYITGASNLRDTGVLVNRWTEKPTVIARAGDILLTCKGSGVGKCAIMDIPEAHVARQIMSLRCKAGITQGYLSTFIKAKFDYFKQNANGLIPGLSRKFVLGMKIPLPPLAEQKAIVKRLEELLALEREIAADNAALEDLITAAKRKILDLAVSGKLVPRKCEWKMVSLGEVGEFCGGHTPSKANAEFWGGEYLWVTSKDMKSKYIDDTAIKLTKSGADELESLPVGTLLMTTRSGILRRKFPVAIARKPCTINQDQKALRVGCDAIPEFVYVVLSALEDVILKKYVKSGTTVESVIWNKFLNIEISLPSLAEQKAIVKRVEELFAVMDAMKEV